MTLSQSDLAKRLGVTPASVSQATSRGYRCSGYPVEEWAVHDESGRVSGYKVPEGLFDEEPSSDICDDGQPKSQSNMSAESSSQQVPMDSRSLATVPSPNSQSLFSYINGFPPVDPLTDFQVNASQRTSLLPEGQDYFRSAGAGGAAYVMKAAIDQDNGTARGAVMVGGTTVGGLTGWYVTDKDPVGALIGAGIGWLAAITGIRSSRTEQEQERIAGSQRQLPRQRVT